MSSNPHNVTLKYQRQKLRLDCINENVSKTQISKEEQVSSDISLVSKRSIRKKW